MKLLTLNAHSHLEADYERKLVYFAEYILREQVDLIALQESNQSQNAPEAEGWLLEGMYPLADERIPVRADNHAAWTAFLLRQAGIHCSWVWLPVKLGYGRFDEGLAVLSFRREIAEADACRISRTDEYADWKRRKILGVRLKNMESWFCSVHMGWWKDDEEPFLDQWMQLEKQLVGKRNQPVWLMGDFNSPAGVRGEGYDLICASGWHDLYLSAEERRGCATVRGTIDGWHSEADSGMRIDYIFCSEPVRVRSAGVVFDGEREKQVSDHFAVLMEADVD